MTIRMQVVLRNLIKFKEFMFAGNKIATTIMQIF